MRGLSLWDASRGCQAGPLRRPSRRAIRYRWRAICYTRAPRHMRQCRLRSSGEEADMTSPVSRIRAEALLDPTDGVVAERVGFEPTVPLQVQRFSRPPRSTTLAPLRTKGRGLLESGRTIAMAAPCCKPGFTRFSRFSGRFAGDLAACQGLAVPAPSVA